MAQVDIDAGGINPIFDPEGFVLSDRSIQFTRKFIGGNYLIHAVFYQLKLLCGSFQDALLRSNQVSGNKLKGIFMMGQVGSWRIFFPGNRNHIKPE